MEVVFVAKQATAEKRQRRERGSINPDDIIKGAFELAEDVGIDNCPCHCSASTSASA